MSPTLVVNRRYEAYDVYIGRPSRWGNPFSHVGLPDDRMGSRYRTVRVKTRDEAIERYREWIQTQPQLLAALHELRGKRLGCWCAPKRCHGEILAELADALEV